VGIKSKTITSVKENFRSLLDTLSNEFHFPNRSSKKKVIDVSWPQSVVKTVEFGSPIERPIKIQNQHERILGQQTRVPAAVASEPVENLPSLNNDAAAIEQETIAVEVEEATNVTANPANIVSLDEVRDVNVGNAEQGNRASINTTSVQEWMSEPRTSWRQSAPRTKATVSKVRHMKPELRSVPVNNLRPDVAQRTPNETALNHIQSQADLSSNPPTQRRSSPTSTPQTGNNDSPSVHSKRSPPRREFVIPRAIAIKKDSWRYSVDAAVSCNRERTQNRYSMPGDGFSDLLPSNEIRDSDTLEKITKLRQEGLERATNPGDRPGIRGFGSSKTDAETQQKISELRQTTQHFHGARVRENNVVEGYGDTPAPPRDPVESSQVDAPSKDSEPVTIPTPSIPPPDSSHPPRTPELRPSTVSSNIRTPKAYVGLTHDIADRVQVQIYPRETKAESTERGRAAVLERWVDRELLRHRRQESKGVERKDEEGVIWRSADILLGKAKYAPGPAIVREFPLQAPKPAPVPRGPNGVGPSTDSRFYKFPPPRLPRVPQNSPVESDFSDIISTARYPHRMPGSSQRFPPPPSRAIVSYSTSTSPDTQPSSRTVTPGMVNPSSYRQPGPWNIPDLVNHHTTTPISASLAQEVLIKYVRRPLHPIHSQNRDRRLAESQLFFTMEPPLNIYFNDLKDMVGYALEAQKAVQREGFTQEPTTLNRVNFLRLIISKEFLPYPLVCKDIFPTLQLFNCAWPIAEVLGLRPFGLLHFMHEEVEIMVFLSTEDEAMYLWSQEWDDGIFGARTLIRAGTTIDDCERGILNGLHVIRFEQGGWLKIEGYDDKTIEELNAETEEDLYGYVDWTKGLNVQM